MAAFEPEQRRIDPIHETHDRQQREHRLQRAQSIMCSLREHGLQCIAALARIKEVVLDLMALAGVLRTSYANMDTSEWAIPSPRAWPHEHSRRCDAWTVCSSPMAGEQSHSDTCMLTTAECECASVQCANVRFLLFLSVHGPLSCKFDSHRADKARARRVCMYFDSTLLRPRVTEYRSRGT